MSHIIYPTHVGVKRGGNPTSLTPQKCLEFYLKHLTNVLTLEKLKGLHPNDFKWTSQCESEISIGRRKMEHWYARGDFSTSDLCKGVTTVKKQVQQLKIG